MARVYFDTNIFSNLKRNSDPVSVQLNQDIEKFKRNLSFVFSPAHIRDKRRDLTDKKLGDFDFMASLTGDNYISYHAIEKKTTFYLALPRTVFDDKTDGDELSEISRFWDTDSDNEELNLYKSTLKTIYSNFPAGIDTAKLSELPEEHRNVLKGFIPEGKENLTLLDIMEKLTTFSGEIYSNHQTYKDLRKLIDDNFNGGKYVLDGKVDFNESFKDSVFKKTFFEYVADTLRGNDPEKVFTLYDLYTHGYMCMDMLGVKKDTITKKNSFNNLLNDALHSYYAAHCDYLVTDDETTKEKSNALFTLFEFPTKALTATEFAQILPDIGRDSETDIIHFFWKLLNDVSNSPELGESIPEEDAIRTIPAGAPFFNFLDEIFEVKGDTDKLFYLWKKDSSHSLSQPNYREKGQIIDRCLRIFGPDYGGKGPMDFEKEVEEIRAGEWEGRVWVIGPLLVNLHCNKDLQKLLLAISSMKGE
jgi:hypothetical protein